MPGQRPIRRARRCALPRAARVLLPILAVACGDAATPDAPPDARPASAEGWKEQRARLDSSVWADEKLAGEYEQVLVSLWDALIAAGRRGDEAGKIEALTSIGFDELEVGTPQLVEVLDHGIEVSRFDAPTSAWSAEDWARAVRELHAGGTRLIQSEWHHAAFSPATSGAPARSTVAFALYLQGPGAAPGTPRRSVLEGNLEVEWSERRDARGRHVPRRVDATGLRLLARDGPPGFEEILRFEHRESGRRSWIHPVLLYDLDRDGLPEIVMVQAGRVLWNRGGGSFEDAALLEHPYRLTETGVIADLDGDARPDLLTTRARGDVALYRGGAGGRFATPPVITPRLDYPLHAPSALSVGDVDGDRDLDVWLAQYKPAYAEGQMPTPFYDANDGYPSYLFLNDGSGGLVPATEAAGLAERRHRRTYTSSLVDLDGDGDLDLLVVSDYSGVDLYHNDGSGHFTDANDTLRADRHLFGMSASFADYDLDGRLDFFVAGMASTTARRLERLGLGREDRRDVGEMRMRMAFGNRMYLADDGGWREPDFASEVARTGWTWGTSALDFDNDGDPDIFAANGHRSGETTDDYCSDFWRHDIYDGRSQPDPGLADLFEENARRFAAGEQSWDGYQKNHLLMNRGGRGFTNVAFLLGVADEFDSRSAVSADLDRDGRVDLVVVEDLREDGQRLHVYRNRLETPNAWIGVDLVEEGGGVSPVGAAVVVRTPDRVQVGRVVTGETLMGQHAPTLHFGLGAASQVDAIEVRWVDGSTRTLLRPEIGRYHRVLASAPPP